MGRGTGEKGAMLFPLPIISKPILNIVSRKHKYPSMLHRDEKCAHLPTKYTGWWHNWPSHIIWKIGRLSHIAEFYLTSWWPCWSTLNKRILIISFVWDSNVAAMTIVFCVSWDCVKPKNYPTGVSYLIVTVVWLTKCAIPQSKIPSPTPQHKSCVSAKFLKTLAEHMQVRDKQACDKPRAFLLPMTNEFDNHWY